MQTVHEFVYKSSFVTTGHALTLDSVAVSYQHPGKFLDSSSRHPLPVSTPCPECTSPLLTPRVDPVGLQQPPGAERLGVRYSLVLRSLVCLSCVHYLLPPLSISRLCISNPRVTHVFPTLVPCGESTVVCPDLTFP